MKETMSKSKIVRAVKQYWKADNLPTERNETTLIALARDLNQDEFNEYVRQTSPKEDSKQ